MINKQIRIYISISDSILNLKFPPNEVLKERDLANKYSTSRTTVRQTLQKLASEKKIIIVPRSKTTVAKINLKKIKESFLLRESLELTVASLIIKKIEKKNLNYLYNNIQKQKKILLHYNYNNKKYIALDNEFHKYLFEIVGLKTFWNILSDYNFDFNRLRHLAAINNKRAKESTKEHLNIFKSLKEKKIRNMRKAIKTHFDNSAKYYKKLKKLNPNLIE